jgi:hypothetical protein
VGRLSGMTSPPVSTRRRRHVPGSLPRVSVLVHQECSSAHHPSHHPRWSCHAGAEPTREARPKAEWACSTNVHAPGEHICAACTGHLVVASAN